TADGKPVFHDETAPDHRSELLRHWLGGLTTTMNGAVSYLCPTINSYRRMIDFAAVPVTPTWGEENKSAAIRLISGNPDLARIAHRIGTADLNPYFSMAFTLAPPPAALPTRLSPPTP
ncbi:MAG: glutamine synthetase, partial [Pseudomonadales bacterium]|nr:glutamine synthetase [Pseudomonadales bacterium]